MIRKIYKHFTKIQMIQTVQIIQITRILYKFVQKMAFVDRTRQGRNLVKKRTRKTASTSDFYKHFTNKMDVYKNFYK